MIRIALIGCTGSIGRQVCQVVRRYPNRFSFSVLVSGREGDALRALADEFSPRLAVGAERAEKEELFGDCDVALIAASGFAGLSYTLKAVRAGKRIALANKESLVCGGELVLREAERCGAELVPVDSEHSAIFQALGFSRSAPFAKLILTASGGPFLGLSKEEMEQVTPKDALRHPTWHMGRKISVDSATLLNKGYEVIEAHHLYGAEYERIETVVHPESVVHSLVCFADGAMIAQLGYPSMEVPIQLALTYPERLPCAEPLDLAKFGALHFLRLPEEKFPCFSLAVRAGKEGGTLPAVLNAAGEVAVSAFLDGRITFPQIAETIECALEKIPKERAESYEAISSADSRARESAKRYISRL